MPISDRRHTEQQQDDDTLLFVMCIESTEKEISLFASLSLSDNKLGLKRWERKKIARNLD